MQSRLCRSGVCFLAFATLATAQSNTTRRTVWDGVYTETQAARGLADYNRSCLGCHALEPEGKVPLAGDPFWKSFSQKTAADLLEFVSTYMPNGAPGSLSQSTYEDIVAFILKSNGFPAGTTEFGPTTISGVKIVPKDGSTELPANALVRVIGCLTRNGAEWILTNATNPEREEGASENAELGSRRMVLKFVVTRLDSLVGTRVAVSGLLIGAGGVDGLNVTSVTRVADKCP